MNILETAIPRLWEDSSFIALLQVVTDVHEAGSLEGGSELARLSVTWNQAREPVIGDAHAWNHLTLAHVLKAGFAEDCELADGIGGGEIRVWLRENLSIVQEH